MKRILTIFLISIIVIISGCDNDSDFCANIAFLAPSDTTLIFVDQDTGEDLFTNGTLNIDDLTAIDLDTGEVIPFFTIPASENFFTPEIVDDSITTINLDFGTEERNYNIEISVAPIIQFNYSFEIDFIPRNPSQQRCVSNTILLNPTFKGITFEQDEIFTRFFTIFL